MIYDIGRNIWITSKPQQFPAINTAVESPNTSKPVSGDPSGVPGSDNTNNGTGESGPSPGNPNLPLIIGVSVVGGVLLILIIGL
ncbi:hypothetical protein BGX34_007812, partial [Mortierella sp. NVP85]